jgi:membrane-bound ClpP family serine protease
MSDNVLWGVILIGGAFVLALIEIFVPSMGLIAALAGLCALGGVVFLFQEGAAWGLTGIGVSVAGAVGAFVFALRVLPHTPAGRGLILGGARDVDDDEIPPTTPADQRELEQALLGAEGVVKSPLHPVGTAEIEGARVEVIARTGVIDAGTRVRVVEVRGNEIYVRPIDE